MTITLSTEQEQFIADALESGAFGSAEDVIARALEVLRAEEGLLHDEKSMISEKIERGVAQYERGEFFSPEESRADMQRRKAEWLSSQGR
ncbi:hypothetical protein F183_A11500 [Bryobacterales bacterium F-183]|nr:hypothetical protein F183_A11500 [Bryobacterales bacterium F-183]